MNALPADAGNAPKLSLRNRVGGVQSAVAVYVAKPHAIHRNHSEKKSSSWFFADSE